MSYDGRFVKEDQDIVRLQKPRGFDSAKGWINVGRHAVRLILHPNGDLTVESYALGNEEVALAAFGVSEEAAIKAGAMEPVA